MQLGDCLDNVTFVIAPFASERRNPLRRIVGIASGSNEQKAFV
jgi:hypothetical protein